jgi:GNAT superfamily N-acetyltransferase
VKSTKMSVRNILGAVPVVLTSPTAGPAFTTTRLREKVHFVNCHGNQSDHTFSGEGPRDSYTTAMDTRKLAGVGAGTVAAFECCYGAELYDPQGLPAMSLANAYLAKGAAGVVASTTIAYGPADDNANADVICQLFVEQLLQGASLGRALLEARLGYLRRQSVADPYDEKTLAQFVLLGDPSLHPFSASAAPRAKASPTAKAQTHAARLQRRVRLMKAGERLSRECAYTVPVRSARRVAGALRTKALAAANRRFGHVRVFQVHEPAVKRAPAAGKALRAMPKARHVFVATKQRGTSASDTATPRVDGLLAYEVNGTLVTRLLQSR